MRITFICPPPDLSGGQRVIAIYASMLARRGHRVAVVAVPSPRPSPRAIARAFRRGRWPWPRRRPSHLDLLGVPPRLLEAHRPAEDRDVPDADVVIATWWETAEWVAALSPRKGAKVYFVQHYETFPGQPADRVEATYRLPMPKIVVADWLGELLRDRFGATDVTLVANAVDHGLFHAPPRDRGSPPTIGLMYSTVPFKGCDVSLRAFEAAASRVDGLRLLAFGDMPVDPELPLPPGAEYHLRPAQGMLRGLYARCDAWLFGSRSEGFGLPILEAMACRTPVIGTPAGAAPELLSEGGGMLVRPEDPEDMARAIERLCAMPAAEWRRRSEAAHATASRHSWERSADRFERALRAAAGSATAGAPGA